MSIRLSSVPTIICRSWFLPVLSGFQDDKERLLRAMRQMNRFAAYLLFPTFLLLITVAEPIFHILFGTKWDEAIVLFQILVARGIFLVLTSLYNNYILAIGRSKALVSYEIVKDVLMVAAICVTIPYGVTEMIWGQFAASGLFYVYALVFTGHVTGYRVRNIVGDVLPYFFIALLVACCQLAVGTWLSNAWLSLLVQSAVCVVVYYGINRLLRSNIQREVLTYAFGRFRKNKA